MITSVRYSVEFNVNGLKRWLGAEATVSEGASEDAELDLILDFIRRTDQRVHGAQPQSSAPLPPEPKELPIRQVEKDEEFEPIPTLVAIASCKSPTVLKIYKNQLKSKAEEIAYEEKMQELMKSKIG